MSGQQHRDTRIHTSAGARQARLAFVRSDGLASSPVFGEATRHTSQAAGGACVQMSRSLF
eukprot:29717-Chlamydomonas_euryale.AAC.14